jgi:predicted extracellular nuclease
MLILFFSINAFSQSTERIMFYNTENFFDTYDEIDKKDEAFLPASNRHWTNSRYKRKLLNFSKVVAEVSYDHLPAIIGLAEIENITVLNDIIKHSALSNKHYSFIHKESADIRGIDVAIIYNINRFKPLKKVFIPVCFSFKRKHYSRDILYVKGVLGSKDTIHLFVNHWSSRLGGKKKTEYKRLFQSKLLSSKIDSIKFNNNEAKIVIMGDFNDTPKDISVKDILCNKSDLKNLAMNLYKKREGTYKYKAYWDLFDQIIVSKSVKSSSMHICMSSFILEQDHKYGGFKPKRTYNGMRYNEGFSDHLPVYIDLFLQ